jgi:hypothetical protein
MNETRGSAVTRENLPRSPLDATPPSMMRQAGYEQIAEMVADHNR